MSNESSTNGNQGKAATTPMTPSAASRIQGHADRSGTNAGFKGRAMAAGARNAGQGGGHGGKAGGKGK